MMNAPRALTFAALLLATAAALAAGPARAADETYSIVTLGRDTTSVEHMVRTPERVVVDMVGRSPRVRLRHFEYEFDAAGVMQKFTLRVTDPNAAAGAPPLQTVDAHWVGDSLRMEAATAVRTDVSMIRVPAGALLVASSSPWAMYERASMRLARGKADTLGSPIYLLGAPNAERMMLRRLGRDSVEIRDTHGSVFRARVDKDGRLLGVRPMSGTGQFAVATVPSADLAGMAAAFTAREQAGAGLGVLSTRDTARVENAGGANVWIDYGRPAVRGRAIFGGIVPFDAIWRTGANAATQFKTDRALVINGVEVPAGFYSLWSVPTAKGWTLVFNSQTGQWGTEHDPARDLYKVELAVSAPPSPVERFTIAIAPAADGGTITFDWADRRGTATFRVKS